MLSTKERDRREGQHRSRRRQELEGIVRSSHERMILDKTYADGETETDDSVRIDSWDEMVFEGRNREYGAYVVRKGYRKNLFIGVLTTIIAVGMILVSPTLAKLMRGDKTPVQTSPRKLVYTELSAPPPIDKPKPPPPQVQLPRLQKVIKFVPPKVVKEQVAEIPPSLAEIRENEIGAEAIEGPIDVIFDEPAVEVVAPGDDEIFTVVDQQPEYAGGYEAMLAFIQNNMKYPQRARQMRIDGTVHVSFVVSKTGEISDVKVLRGIMTECDQEAVRVVKMMPPWKPGRQNGHPVNVRFILPLKFRLN